ncbi:MAG: GNAT family N-acetyltransferase [Hyphomonadaceae bacterium]
MDGSAGGLSVSIAQALAEVPRAEWDAVANPPGRPYDPFLSWDFLEALESSGCVTARTGWAPHHVLVKDSSGRLIGAAPLYLKSHSMGEYVFDRGWADALNRAGGRYYPKLQGAVPFTPATGRRLLQAGDDPGIERALAGGALELMRLAKASSIHFTFLTQPEAARLGDLGFLTRTGVQFHWENAGYATFQDFLASLSSIKRKNIRRERARGSEGLDIRALSGGDLTERAWDVFFACYQDTGARKWGSPYLNRRFFSMIGERMADRIILFLAAEPDGRPVATALNFIGGDTLYGRYWGRLADRDFLHFELCYYRAIDEALARGLKRVEAGAQGEHKLARGYAPVATYSSHWIAHAGLRNAVADFLEHEQPAVAEEIEILAEHTPFKKDIA